MAEPLVRALLFGHTNNGPGVPPRLARYFIKALTRHTAYVVFPKQIRSPFLNWSPLMVICINDGEALLSSVTSDNNKSIDGLKWSSADEVNSLTLRSPK